MKLGRDPGVGSVLEIRANYNSGSPTVAGTYASYDSGTAITTYTVASASLAAGSWYLYVASNSDATNLQIYGTGSVFGAVDSSGGTTFYWTTRAGGSAVISGSAYNIPMKIHSSIVGSTAWVLVLQDEPLPTWTAVEIDFGETGVKWANIVVTDAACLTTSQVMVLPSNRTATGRVGNDMEWDQLILSATPGSGSFIVTALAIPGPIQGKRTVLYQIY